MTDNNQEIIVHGRVMAVNVLQGSMQVQLEDKTCIPVCFSPEYEDKVLDALRDHKTRRLWIRGKGRLDSGGRIQEIAKIDELRLQTADDIPYDPNARPIEEVIMEIASKIPEEEWKKIPADASENLDHYLYGSLR
ncbi:MAG: hypothetical protein ACE15F_13545 [bacterium]